MNTQNKEQYEMYPYTYSCHGNKIILIWLTSDNAKDRFMIDGNNNLISSNTVKGFNSILGVDFNKVHWEEGAHIDFDKFWTSLKNLRASRASSITTCERILNVWNFVEDVLYTFDFKDEIKTLKSPILNKVYQKLYSGNNIPSVTPESESYSPLWTDIEIKQLRKVFREIWKALVDRDLIICR